MLRTWQKSPTMWIFEIYPVAAVAPWEHLLHVVDILLGFVLLARKKISALESVLRFVCGKPVSKCMICLDYTDEYSAVELVPCTHIFHEDCIYKWMTKGMRNAGCPNCRAEIWAYEDVIIS